MYKVIFACVHWLRYRIRTQMLSEPNSAFVELIWQ